MVDSQLIKCIRFSYQQVIHTCSTLQAPKGTWLATSKWSKASQTAQFGLSQASTLCQTDSSIAWSKTNQYSHPQWRHTRPIPKALTFNFPLFLVQYWPYFDQLTIWDRLVFQTFPSYSRKYGLYDPVGYAHQKWWKPVSTILDHTQNMSKLSQTLQVWS